ncbi:MAG: hypothetical protein BBJ57_02245 [Desulfobacterales bacterium PC51MH44]|nr:MAG: hypothetical protein BBJ57_02245 [Desulfobacterales bacterium PC51MH44]
MKFHLKVHSIIGGAPGEPGSPGGAVPGGDIGFGEALGGGGGWFSSQISPQTVLDFVFPGLGQTMNALGMLDARGNAPIPGFGRGVSGSSGGPGVGGGPEVGGWSSPVIGSTFAQRGLTTPFRAAAPVKPPVPEPKPAFDPKKKRTGRQETILTSGLSDAPTFKPTLLGQ